MMDTALNCLVLIAAYFAVSIPVSIFIGKFIKAGNPE